MRYRPDLGELPDNDDEGHIMSEPMTKERLENLAAFGRYLYANGCENISELVTEIMRCHAEIERLDWASRLVTHDNLEKPLHLSQRIEKLEAELHAAKAEIERLEKALEGSESLRHTIMTAALDAKRTFTKRISELEQINERLAAAYHELQGAGDAH